MGVVLQWVYSCHGCCVVEGLQFNPSPCGCCVAVVYSCHAYCVVEGLQFNKSPYGCCVKVGGVLSWMLCCRGLAI